MIWTLEGNASMSRRLGVEEAGRTTDASAALSLGYCQELTSSAEPGRGSDDLRSTS
jgi:hypothetical protein